MSQAPSANHQSGQQLGQDKDDHYCVVVNQQQQYALWPRHQTVPAGWAALQITASQQTCNEYVSQVWTDLRPLSARPED